MFDYRQGMKVQQAPTPFRRRLAVVEAAVTDAADALDYVADAGEIADAVEDLIRVRNRFDALITQFMDQAETSGAPRSAGVRTVGQLVAAVANADPATVRPVATRGRWLRDFDGFADAFADGVVTSAHLEFMRRRLDGPRTHMTLRADQAFFVDAARDCSFADFKKVADYWLITVDPDGDEPADQQDRNSLSVRIGRGGRVLIRGELDALSGQAFRTAVDRVAQQLRNADSETGTVRSESQRRAAALNTLVTRGSERADGTHPAPLINIVMSETVAEHLLSQAAQAPEHPSTPAPVRWDDIDGRCELIDGTPIHPRHALGLFGVATFRRHILDAAGRVIDASSNARAFPAWMRNALHIAARGGCQTPGCDAPHHWIQADHIQPHSRNGPTTLTNGQNLCAADNQAKTDSSHHREPVPRRPLHPKRSHRIERRHRTLLEPAT